MTFPECFDRFRESACRLETLPYYADDDGRFTAFAAGRPMPERSVRTSPWLRRIAETTAAGKHWSRVYLVSRKPLTDHARFKLAAYAESAAAGEDIRIADPDPALSGLQTDFWLFDAGTGDPFAAIMEYDPEGRYLGVRMTTRVRGYAAAWDLASRYSVALAAYTQTAIA